MRLDLDAIEATARKAQERSPGPWRIQNNGYDSSRVDRISDSAPKPDGFDDYDGGEWSGNTVLETDGGYYEPKGATAEYIAACSPDVVLALVARIRELERKAKEAHYANRAARVALAERNLYVCNVCERCINETEMGFCLDVYPPIVYCKKCEAAK